MVMVPLSYFLRWGLRKDVRTDSHALTTSFEIDGIPNLFRYGAPLVRLRRAGAPLLEMIKESVIVTLLIISIALTIFLAKLLICSQTFINLKII